ncbi:hypothetical protein ACLOJK_040757 [Asimina triloba]
MTLLHRLRRCCHRRSSLLPPPRPSFVGAQRMQRPPSISPAGPRSSNPGHPSEAPAAALPEVAHCHRRRIATAPPSSAHHACMWLPRQRTPSRTLPVPPAFAEAAHVNAPCSCRLQHVFNIGSAVNDRRFALNAAAKATVLAATVPIRIFYKYM